MGLLNRIVAALSARTPYIVFTPTISAIGSCSHEINFGLMRARREGRKLVMLRPYTLPKKFRFKVANRALFDIVSPHRAEVPAYVRIPVQLALTAVFGSLRTLDLVLGKLFGPGAHLHPSLVYPSLGTATLCRPEELPAGFSWDVVERYHWKEAIQTPLAVGLRPEKHARAHAARVAMGIPEGEWFVGLHVREAGFCHDGEEFRFRNASIANYLPAIREITARGGWVVRLGDPSMTPLPAMERVIDYPHTRFKNELMDLYLISECRFFIGMASGILDTAFLFQRPMVLTNMTNMTFAYPRYPGDRGIPKHLYSRSQGRFLSLREVFDAPPEAQGYWLLGDDFEQHENSPDEIRDVVLEFLGCLESGDASPTPLQAEVNRLRIEHGRRILSRPLLRNHLDDMFARYHIAARLESSLGSLSRSFVAANLERSARDAVSAPRTA